MVGGGGGMTAHPHGRLTLTPACSTAQVQVVGSAKRDGNVYTLDYTHFPTKGGGAGLLEGVVKVGPQHKVTLACARNCTPAACGASPCSGSLQLSLQATLALAHALGSLACWRLHCRRMS